MKHSILLLFILVAISFTSCNSDDATVIPPCQRDIDGSLFGSMRLDGENYFIEDSFIIGSINTIMISGFTEDCIRRDQVRINYNLLNQGDLTGSFTLTRNADNIAGNASGTVLTQIVETLEQRVETVFSGTFTITDNEEGDLFISLELETESGVEVSVDSSI